MTKLKPKERLEQMIDFFDRRGKERGYVISKGNDSNEIEIRYKNGNFYQLLLFSKTIPLTKLIGFNYVMNAPIFYKDEETFFRKMIKYNKGGRTNKSLKTYSKKRIKEITTLTIQERLALFKGDWYSMRNFEEKDLKGKELTYFQPQTQRLKEDLKFFKIILPVEFDYSHLEKEDYGKNFARNGLSKTYFFLLEKKSN